MFPKVTSSARIPYLLPRNAEECQFTERTGGAPLEALSTPFGRHSPPKMSHGSASCRGRQTRKPKISGRGRRTSARWRNNLKSTLKGKLLHQVAGSPHGRSRPHSPKHLRGKGEGSVTEHFQAHRLVVAAGAGSAARPRPEAGTHRAVNPLRVQRSSARGRGWQTGAGGGGGRSEEKLQRCQSEASPPSTGLPVRV